MDTTIGTTQTSLVNSSLAQTAQANYYVARFVSPKLNQTSIAANTWTWNFAVQQSNNSARFPIQSGGSVYVCIYVWRTSTQTKVGTIFDGATPGISYTTAIAERAATTTVSGSAISSLNVNDDVVIFEVWFRPTQATSTSYTQTFYFDGAVEDLTNNNIVSNHASLISTPETIAFAPLLTRISLSQIYKYDILSRLSLSQIYKYNIIARISLSQIYRYDILTKVSLSQIYKYDIVVRISLSQVYKYDILVRISLSRVYNYDILIRFSQSRIYKYNILQRISASQIYKYDILARISLSRIYRYIITAGLQQTTFHFQSPSRTHSILPFLVIAPKSLSIDEAPITISASLNRQKFVSRSTTENIIVISELVDPVKILVRNLAQTITTSGVLTKISIRPKSLTQTVTITGTATQSHVTFKFLTQAITISEATSLLRKKVRSLTQTITVGETLTRVLVKLRSFISVEHVSITDNAFAAKFKSQALAETLIIGEALSRLSLKVKALADSIILGATLTRASIKSRAPGFPEVLTIGESLTKVKKTIRAFAQTIIIGETLTKALTKTRSLAQSITIAGAPVIGKFKTIFINEIPVIVTEQAIPAFIKKVFRNLATQTVSIGESLTKTKKSVRSLVQTIVISEALTEAQIFFKNLAQTITIGDSLTRVKSRFLSVAQTITITDLLTKGRLRVKNIAETLSISDLLSLGKVRGLLILDSITIGDFASVVRLISGAPRWLLAGQVSDFPDSIENLVKAYINSKWSIETPSMGLSPAWQVQTDNFAYDGARTYYMKIKEIASNVMTRRIRLNTYEFETPIELECYSRRLSKGEAFTELNNMINELIRIFSMFEYESIFGIQGITFDRITQIERERSAAQTVWIRRLTLTLHYYKISTVG